MPSKGSKGGYLDVVINAILEGSFFASSEDNIYVFDYAKISKEEYIFADSPEAVKWIDKKVSISEWDFVFNKKKMKKIVKEI